MHDDCPGFLFRGLSKSFYVLGRSGSLLLVEIGSHALERGLVVALGECTSLAERLSGGGSLVSHIVWI